jgi:hypothetical protein
VSGQYSEADFREYLDREAIRDVLYRYAHGIDRCDAELLKTVYWPDAIDDHGDFVGKRDEFIAWVIPRLKSGISVSQHFLGNILIRIDGPIATVESYFQAYHSMVVPRGKPAEDLLIGGRYADRMEKRGREWRIAHRIVIFDYFREYPDSGDWGKAKYVNAQRTLGLRYPDDATRPLFGSSLARRPFDGGSGE